MNFRDYLGNRYQQLLADAGRLGSTKHLAMADVLNRRTPIAKRLTTQIAQQLNAKVDVAGQDPHEVAKEWLIKEGFIKNG